MTRQRLKVWCLAAGAAALVTLIQSQVHAGTLSDYRDGAYASTALDANGNVAGLITAQSAFGPITVSQRFAAKILPTLAELKARGVDAIVKCFAQRPAPGRRGPHVRTSLHFTGDACDLLPKRHQARGRNRMPTPRFMFTRQAAAIIARHGLRNGCSFRDCGHIDAGRRLHFAHARSRSQF